MPIIRREVENTVCGRRVLGLDGEEGEWDINVPFADNVTHKDLFCSRSNNETVILFVTCGRDERKEVEGRTWKNSLGSIL